MHMLLMLIAFDRTVSERAHMEAGKQRCCKHGSKSAHSVMALHDRVGSAGKHSNQTGRCLD